VAAVSDSSGPHYVPPEERIATFDNDGTLCCEQPMSAQMDFVLRRLAVMAEQDPSLREKQPWKAASERDADWITGAAVKHYYGDDTDIKLLFSGGLQSFGEMTVEEYQEAAIRFFAEAKHTTMDVSYLEVGFLPMIELVHYLRGHQFSVYIVSGGGRDFIRTAAEKVYGIPPEHVIGSLINHRYQEKEQGAFIMRQAEGVLLDDGPEKPVHIWDRVGRRPILAGGNANGDIPMLKYAAARVGASLCLLINHDDSDREFEYTKGAEAALKAAKDQGWTVVSVRDDWHSVFAFPKT